MTGVVCISIVLSLAAVYSEQVFPNLLAIYDTGNGSLRIKNLITAHTVKTFIIQADEVAGGLAVDYEGDVIYYADASKIYKIYLIDEFGERRISGKGELFTNFDAEHFEIVFYRTVYTKSSYNKRANRPNPISGLYFDSVTKRLYAALRDLRSYGNGGSSAELFIVNTDTGYLEGMILWYGPPDYRVADNFRGFLIHDGDKYFSNTCEADVVLYCIFRLTPRNRNFRKSDKQLIIYNTYDRATDVSAFAITNQTNKLFYAEDNSIRVLDANLSAKLPPNHSSYPMNKIKVVIADSRVTKSVQALDVYGQFVVWSSLELKRLFRGVLNENGTFISTSNVDVFDSAVKSRNIFIFEDKNNILPYRD